MVYKMHISQLLKDGERTFVRYWDTEIYKKELAKTNATIECIDSFENFNKKFYITAIFITLNFILILHMR